MLLVRARAGASRIHGIGLIAQEFIPRGTRVWELRPGFDLLLSRAEVDALSPAAREQVAWYTFWDPVHQAFVLSGDDDRFTNHSPNPNTDTDNNGGFTYATRDIHAGDEITWDYRAWDRVNFEVISDPDGVAPERGGESEARSAAATLGGEAEAPLAS